MEQETDLRSYLQVVWKEKWIVVSVFVMVVAVAALILFRLPNQYEARALFHLLAPPPLEKIQLQIPSLHKIAELVQSDGLLLEVAQKANISQASSRNPMEIWQWLKNSLKASVLEKASLLELTLQGSLAPQQLSEVLQRIITLMESQLEADLKSETESRLTFLSNLVLAFDKQLKALNEQLQTKIDDRKNILEKQRMELLRQIDQIRSNTQFLRLQVGEQNRTLQGSVLVQEFTALNGHLNAIESDLRKLDSRGYEFFPDLDGRIKSLEEQRSDLVSLLARNRQTLASNWESLSIVSAPYASNRPVAPKRVLSLLIAGILGLLAGILGALFKYYLGQVLAPRTFEK